MCLNRTGLCRLSINKVNERGCQALGYLCARGVPGTGAGGGRLHRAVRALGREAATAVPVSEALAVLFSYLD